MHKTRRKVDINTKKGLLSLFTVQSFLFKSSASQKIPFLAWSVLNHILSSPSAIYWVVSKSSSLLTTSTSWLLTTSLPLDHTDLVGSEVQPFCWLVVLRRSPLWDAHWSVTFPRTRWRRAFPLHPNGQSLLPSMAWEGGKGPSSEGKIWSQGDSIGLVLRILPGAPIHF